MSMNYKPSYNYREAVFSENAQILDFLEKHYFPQQCSMIKILNRDVVEKIEDMQILGYLRAIYRVLLEHLPCFIVIDTKSKEIIGAVLLKLEVNLFYKDKYKLFYELYENNLNKALDAILEEHPLNNWTIDVLQATGELFDPFTDVSNSKVELACKLVIVAINPKHGTREGLSKMEKMLRYALEWAEIKYNVQLFYGLLTSSKAIKASETLNFKKIREQEYPSEKKKEDEEEQPTVTITTMIREESMFQHDSVETEGDE